MTDTATRIAAVIRAELSNPLRRTPLPEITPEMTLADDLGAHLFDVVGICLAIEDEFGFEASDAEFEKCATVGDFVALVDAKRSAA